MWNTFSPEGNALVTYLSNEKMATLPMPYSEVYGTNGRRWYSSAETLELLDFWFNQDDMLELISMGFDVYELEVTEYQRLPNEIIFTKESEVSRKCVTQNFLPEGSNIEWLRRMRKRIYEIPAPDDAMFKQHSAWLRAAELEEQHLASGGTVNIGSKID